jgi:hypothetical protein
MRTAARLKLLLACVAAGLAVGGLGLWLTGSSAGFLAVPALVAAGWLFVADPTACTPHRDHGKR